MDINKTYISTKNTYTGKNVPKYITVHETDNYSSGAGARRHAEAQYKGHLSTSVHFYCGSDGVYQAANISDGTYSVGTEYGGNHFITDASNRNTINIEICVNPDGDYNVARANAIELIKYLISTTGIKVDNVIRHYDAKGKYCPRKMLDNPELWTDFKSQIGQATKDNTSIKLTSEVTSETKSVWYRVGTGWKNGICANQIGAYHNKDFAIKDCKTGYNVYDENGKIIYPISIGTTTSTSAQPTTTSATSTSSTAIGSTTSYIQTDFIKNVQSAIGARVDGCAGSETLSKTPTISKSKNTKHSVVKFLQKRLNALGFDCGVADGVAGSKFDTATKAFQKANGCVVDGEWTSGKTSWKKILGMI